MHFRHVSLLVLVGIAAAAAAHAQEPVSIGSQLEPMVDRHLIDSVDGASLMLHAPQAGEAVVQFDHPWEGRFCGYVTAIKDGRLYHLYYRGLPRAGADGSDLETTCYAVSVDGVHWNKPDLGLFEVMGTRRNNCVLAGKPPFSHNFAPFLDTRPDVPADERFKALAGTGRSGLVAFVSGDGVHWRTLREEPIITEGAFDSQNVAFWSDLEQCYCCYFRTWTKEHNVRSVSRATSTDFVNWTDPVEMNFGDTAREHLYTNNTAPYYRAPHIYTAIAARFMPGRRVVSQEQMAAMSGNVGYSGDCSDTVFMTSRGGARYDRTFMEGFVRPGIGPENWTSRTNYPAHGLIPVGESQMSFYVCRNYGQDSAYLQRMILRVDGFASVHATYQGGEMRTRPLVFTGAALAINFATSAAGDIRVEIQDAEGNPLPGYTQADADAIIGDAIERTVSWQGNTNVSALAGTPVRLRFIMKDADLYALQFR